ncbi:MAG: helix-hairpin-helix domain-containing protein [Anaerolineales bacterium]|nr:helix-hairpin-helix domain-containing protein [Anaerolineales bacterium]
MDSLDTLVELSSQMELEHAEETRNPVGRVDASDNEHRIETKPSCFTPKARPEFTEREKRAAFAHPAQLPNGKNIVLLKTLLSSACERDCYYCPFRAGRDFRRATFKPDEFANLFGKMYQRGLVEGVFLSSGIAGGGVRTQDKLLDTAEILRKKQNFRGYLHLKLMPGSEKDQVFRAMQLADRLSVNLEAPNTERLAKLAPHKIFIEELMRPLRFIEEIRRNEPAYKFWNGKYPSAVTQFVAGGADESDLELLTTTHWLIKNICLQRAYYSAFHPIHDTPLENKPAVNPMREHRLYQASFLLRDYDFDLEDLPFTSDENLPLHADPKLAWANLNLIHSPIEINTADKHQLIKIPGIGLKGAEVILNARRMNKINSLSALKKLNILADKAAPFILLNGKKPSTQLAMSFL